MRIALFLLTKGLGKQGRLSTPSLFPGLTRARIMILCLLLVLPHYLNDLVIIYLNINFITWRQVQGQWLVDISIPKWPVWAFDFATYLLIPLVLLIVFHRKRYFTLAHFDFRLDHFWKNFLIGTLMTVPIILLLFFQGQFLDAWLRKIYNGSQIYPFLYKPEEGLWKYILLAVYFGVSAGFFEEVVIRALFIRSFERAGLSTPWAAGLSLLIFVTIHWGMGAYVLFCALWIGLIYTLVYVKLRNTLPLVVSHTLVDLVYSTGLYEYLQSELSRLW